MKHSSAKHFALFGATGKTGRNVLPLLLDAGHSVRAYVRSPEKITLPHLNLEVIKGELDNANGINEAIRGVDAVIVMVGHPLGDRSFHGGLLLPLVKTVHQAMTEHGVKRILLQTGAVSVVKDEPFSFLKHIVLRQLFSRLVGQHGVHLDNDQAIHYIERQATELEWIITRPPGLVEVPEDKKPVIAMKKMPMPPTLSFQGLAAYSVTAVQDDNAIGTADYCGYTK